MLVIKIVALLFALLFLISSIFLNNLIVNNNNHLEPTSEPRLFSLAVVQFILIIYSGIFSRLEDPKEFLRWGFILSVILAAILSMTEMYIFRNRDQFIKDSFNQEFSEPIELFYVNFYFLIYVFSYIGCFFIGVSLFVLFCYQIVRMRRILSIIQDNVKEVQFIGNENQEECPICLGSFSSGETLLKLKCSHIFHQGCLRDWLKINASCPNCRLNLLDPNLLQRDQEEN